MSSKDKPEFIQPPDLKAKVRVLMGDSDKLLAQGDAAVGALQTDFTLMLRRDMEKLIDLIRAASSDESKKVACVLQIKEIFNAMRGQGSTFDYPLVSQIADSGHAFISAAKNMNAENLSLVRAHVESLRAVVHGDIKGDGGFVGVELLAALRATIDRVKGTA